MNHEVALHNETHSRNSSSSLDSDFGVTVVQNVEKTNSYSNKLPSDSNDGIDSQLPFTRNNQITKTKKRSNSRVIKSKKLPQENLVKLQQCNSSISLPTENNLLESQTFYSEFENEKIDHISDYNSEIINRRTNDTTHYQNKENSTNTLLENDQLPKDITYHKKWKKILSKMFFYDYKDTNNNKNSEGISETTNQDNSQKTKELYVLLNKKETKKLMKMKSDSKYHKCDNLSVLSCTKGNIVRKFKNSVFQGVPDSLRGTLWQTIIDPFHSFCIKLNPEIASSMNTYNFNEDTTNTNDNTFQNNESCTSDKDTVDNEIDETDNESSLNGTSSYLSHTNSCQGSHENAKSVTNSNYNVDTDRSIEYVKVNVHTNPNLMQFLANRASQNIVNSIEGDIGRTLIQFPKMRIPATQQSLKKILSAYSVIDVNLGYSQGMAFIAAMLLLYMDEHSSFNCFCNIMLSKRFGLRSLFVNGFPRVALMNKVWDVALQNYFPHLHRKLKQNNIDPIVYTLGWWIGNFLNFPLPNEILLLLFDRCLLFGSTSLISFGLTIFGVCHEYLEKSSIDEMVALLQMPSSCPKMLNSKEVIYQWNTNFWISKKNYAKILKKANVSFLP